MYLLARREDKRYSGDWSRRSGVGYTVNSEDLKKNIEDVKVIPYGSR